MFLADLLDHCGAFCDHIDQLCYARFIVIIFRLFVVIMDEVVYQCGYEGCGSEGYAMKLDCF